MNWANLSVEPSRRGAHRARLGTDWRRRRRAAGTVVRVCFGNARAARRCALSATARSGFFSVKGFGLVSTGTVVAGAVEEGASVDVLPSGRSARVRTIQQHGQTVARASAGDRAAINSSVLNSNRSSAATY